MQSHAGREGSWQAAAPAPDKPLRDPRVIAFLLVWFGVNILFGVFSIGAGGVDQAIAWQAHIGGFVTGLVAFAAFDPVPMATGHGDDAGPGSAAGIH